jgi:hypothetical protein
MLAQRAVLLAQLVERALHLLELLPELLQLRVAAGARHNLGAPEAKKCHEEQRLVGVIRSGSRGFTGGVHDGRFRGLRADGPLSTGGWKHGRPDY